MKWTLILSVLIFFTGCVNTSRTPVQQSGVDGRTHTIEGGGFVVKDGVMLYKSLEVNSLIGGCPPLFGLNLPQTRCLPHYLQNIQIVVRPVKAGQNIYEAKGNRPVGWGKYGFTKEIVLPLRPSDAQAQCYIITSQNGALLPVRKGQGLNRFLFSNPLYSHRQQQRIAEAGEKNIKESLNITYLQKKEAENKLNRNPAYLRGRCILQKQKPLPPKPRNVMSRQEGEFNADGFCFTLLAVRHSIGVVKNAMDSIGEFGLLDVASKWRKKRAPSCAKSLHSQLQDTLCQVGSEKGSMFRHWNRSCIQDLFSACRQKVLNNCLGQMAVWRAEVQRVKNAPSIEKKRCQMEVNSLKNINRSIKQNQKWVKDYQLQQTMTAPKPAGQMIDLKNSICL